MKKLLFGLILALYVSVSQAGIIFDGDIFTCDGTTCTPKYGMLLNGAGSAGITVGSSPIASGINGYLLYNNAGILGNLNPAGLTITWGQITGTPTTIAGYGITDAFNSSIPTPIGSTTPNTITGTTGTFNSTLTAYRYVAGGTTVNSGNFSLTAGGGGTWGPGSALSAISGKDSGFTATVTSGSGPTPNPILTLTFTNGAWGSAPFPMCGSWVTGTTAVTNIATTTTTTLAMQFVGTPTASTAYIITCPFIHQ